MASVMISPPGSEFGPCLTQDKPCCTHIDCAQLRAQAESLCTICSKPVGYERQFYGNYDNYEPLGTFVHAVCEHERIEESKRLERIMDRIGYQEIRSTSGIKRSEI